MRETNTIATEIVELSEIKSAYNHFLASHLGQVNVENTTYIKRNKTIVSGNLRKLYVELEEAKGIRDKAEDRNEIADSRLKDTDDRLQIVEKSNNKLQLPNNKLQTTNHKLQTDENPQPDNRNMRMKFEPYHATELEDRAILLFNSDRRYSITE